MGSCSMGSVRTTSPETPFSDCKRAHTHVSASPNANPTLTEEEEEVAGIRSLARVDG